MSDINKMYSVLEVKSYFVAQPQNAGFKVVAGRFVLFCVCACHK